ncbi:MAG: hypothetical protein AB7V32_02595 [Candidatus Berkiella sp.]
MLKDIINFIKNDDLTGLKEYLKGTGSIGLDDKEIGLLFKEAINANSEKVFRFLLRAHSFQGYISNNAHIFFTHAYFGNKSKIIKALMASSLPFKDIIIEEEGKRIKAAIIRLATKMVSQAYGPDVKKDKIVASIIDKSMSLKDFFNLHYRFVRKCEEYSPTVDYVKFDDMFSQLMAVIIKLKIDIEIDSHQPLAKQSLSKTVTKPKGTTPVWTKAKEDTMTSLRVSLDKIFSSIIANQAQRQIVLYTGDGSLAARQKYETIFQYPPSAIYEAISDYVERLLQPDWENESSPMMSVEKVHANLIWSALSSQYVMIDNGDDVDVFLPEGQIDADSSIFWNYELNQLKMQQMAANRKGGELKYFKLNDAAILQLKHEENNIRLVKASRHETKKLLENLSDQTSVHAKNLIDEYIEQSKLIKFHESKKHAILETLSNWEPMRFEDVKFKDTRVGNRQLTINDMMNMTQRLKAFATQSKLKRDEQSATTALVSAYQSLSLKNPKDNEPKKPPTLSIKKDKSPKKS